jgi:FAD/FMN-containing dehydrogenase
MLPEKKVFFILRILQAWIKVPLAEMPQHLQEVLHALNMVRQDSIALQKDIKKLFDPNMILNPGKIF